jgi:hypothetical protein
MPSTIEAVRAEALFVSDLQSSESPAAEQVRGAVAVTLRRLGIRGCAAEVAGEFGDHPDCAVTRMAWALATVRATYPPRRTSTPRAVAARPSGTSRPAGAMRLAG